jgi:hypothetical protein
LELEDSEPGSSSQLPSDLDSTVPQKVTVSSPYYTPKKPTFTIAIEKQYAIIAGTVTVGLAIAAGLITLAWHKLKAKRERKSSKSQRRHQREWSTG